MTTTRGVPAFLLITFGLGWGWEFLVHLGLGWSLVNPLVQLPAAFAPAIGALVVRKWITREGFADAGSRLRLRAAGKYYLLAWWGPLGVAAAVLALAAATGQWTGDLGGLDELVGGVPRWAVPLLLLVAALAGTALFWGEEFGWTAYLLLRVSPGRPRRAALLAGLIAAVWHFPLAFLGYADYRHLALGLAGWTGWIMGQEILLAWLRERSGSVWPACLAHSANNFVLAPLTAALLAGVSTEGVQTLIVVVLVVVAAVPFWRAADGQRRARRRSPDMPVWYGTE
jgi:uncharacterized protein